MAEKLGTRDVYGKTLVELGEKNPNIVVLDADLSESTRTAKFAQKFPARFFNMGVSEQDMIGTAAGLAAGGKIPFVSTFAIFATGRAWEQVRQSVCFGKMNVKIVASHGGLTVGPDGGTHQAIEDLALMRVLPNQIVIMPADGHETAAIIRAITEYKGPVYVRTAREKFPVLYPADIEFEIGRAKIHREGNDATIIACGLMVSQAIEAAAILERDGIDVGVINMSTIKPLDEDAVYDAAKRSGAIVTAEEHSVIGGLGSAVAEFLSENRPVPMVRVGIRDMFGMSGDPADLLAHFGLTPEGIVKAVKKAVAMKSEVA